MIKKTSLFVYGPFAEGRILGSKLEHFVKRRDSATALGSAYRLEVGYPVFCKEGDDWIPGQLVELEAPEILFKLLDEFHGYLPSDSNKCLFFREAVKVKTELEGEIEVEAYVYNLQKLTRNCTKIESGDWPKNLADNPSLVSHLTDRQKDYIQRLGASSGRDIVPIQLDLYRELMKLDLVVDKGRRLALTRLGKEVYRHLDWKWSQVLEQ